MLRGKREKSSNGASMSKTVLAWAQIGNLRSVKCLPANEAKHFISSL